MASELAVGQRVRFVGPAHAGEVYSSFIGHEGTVTEIRPHNDPFTVTFVTDLHYELYVRPSEVEAI